MSAVRPRTRTDTLAVTDILTASLARVLAVDLVDTLALTDDLSAAGGTVHHTQDTVTTTDVLTTALAASRTSADMVGVADTLAAVLVRELVVDLVDGLGVSDIVTTSGAPLPDDVELVLGPGPVGSAFALGDPVGHPLSLSTPRR
ncbi:hypothetical protein JN535_04320 [Cellulosimicrobium cellulans]|uniref:hypothetical protein n=1 Tax=Cellulosimicrobium cellulans TaxID=1710 RepID=UPI001966711A|nr:hypothetical protein [Cellulosimicrobium cellulans]MBN0039400.1 hypothetical protein [Cellulosimicrobium cellulans]